MNFYDVAYLSPKGIKGLHVAVQAVSEYEAARISPVILSSGTPWTPEEFTVLEVVISEYIPVLEKQND